IYLCATLKIERINTIIAMMWAAAENRVLQRFSMGEDWRMEGVEGAIKVEERSAPDAGAGGKDRVRSEKVQRADFIVSTEETPARPSGCVGSLKKVCVSGNLKAPHYRPRFGRAFGCSLGPSSSAPRSSTRADDAI
ncbi:MAG: hypothetical protein WBE14_17410, partial [Xanthobacteraceae bacterium]